MNNSCDTYACLSLFGDLQSTTTSIYTKASSNETFIFSVNVSTSAGRVSRANSEIVIKPASIPFVWGGFTSGNLNPITGTIKVPVPVKQIFNDYKFKWIQLK
jgi:hypothetical protein